MHYVLIAAVTVELGWLLGFAVGRYALLLVEAAAALAAAHWVSGAAPAAVPLFVFAAPASAAGVMARRALHAGRKIGA